MQGFMILAIIGTETDTFSILPDANVDGQTDGKLNSYMISHPALSRCDKNEAVHLGALCSGSALFVNTCLSENFFPK